MESREDIPPLYRGYVWAGLLNVKSDVNLVYNAIDKESYTPTDRQVRFWILGVGVSGEIQPKELNNGKKVHSGEPGGEK